MKPDFGIKEERSVDGKKVFVVEMSKASYQGKPWVTLGDWGKRKWENLLVLSYPSERVQILYV